MKKEYKESSDKYVIYLVAEKMEGYDDDAIRMAFEAYNDGLNDAIGLLWRGAQCLPTIEKDILIENMNGKCRIEKFHTGKWDNMVEEFKIKRWAYTDDLMPDK